MKPSDVMSTHWKTCWATGLDELEKQHLFRRLEVASGTEFSHNDYFGLSQHPRIRGAGRRYLESHPAGSGGSRLLGGNREIFSECERSIAAFFGAPAALLFSSGYLANLSAVTAAAHFANTIVSDAANHASLIDAIRLTGKPRTIFPHQAWPEPSEFHHPLVVCESLYSMDGDLLSLSDFNAFRETAGAFSVVDEAHAACVLREHGRGWLEDERDWSGLAKIVTFGKAVGVAGGAVLGSQEFIHWLVNRGRSFIYSTAPSPVVAAMIQESLNLIQEEGARLRSALWARAEYLKTRWLQAGLDLGSTVFTEGWNARTPIVPVMLSGEDRALRFAYFMRQSGFHVRAVRYPTVPRGQERLRVTVTLSPSDSEFEAFCQIGIKLWKQSS